MREHSREYRLIGQRLIKEREEFFFIHDFGIKIAYLVSDEVKKKNKKVVFADCTIVDDKYKWCCKYDFFITVYLPNVEAYGFTDEKKEILIRHELKHVGIDVTGVEPKFYIVPHDVEEFMDIIHEHGLTWEVS